MERKTKVNKLITFTNIVMTVAVVMIHSNPSSMLENDEMIFVKFFTLIDTICDMAVPSFFFISAFLFYRNVTDIKKQYGAKMHKRLKTLVVPYFIFSGGWMVLFSLMSLVPFTNSFIDNSMFESTLVENVDAFLMSRYYGPSWFLQVLFFLCLISPIIYYVIKSNVIIAPCVSGVLLIVNCIFPTSHFGLISWVPLFTMGIWCALFFDKIDARIQTWEKNNKAKLLIIILWGVIFYGALGNRSSNVIDEPRYHVYRILGGILFLLILYMIIPTDKVHDKLRLSEMTFFIYMVHFPIVCIIKELLVLVIPARGIMSIVVYVLTVSIGIFCICCIGRLCKRLTPKIWKIICGGR